MFSKTLVLLLLGCSLALVQAAHMNGKTDVDIVRSGVSDSFAAWYQKAKTVIKNTFDKAIQGFEKIYNNLVNTGKNVSEFSKEKLEELKAKYHDIKNEAKKKLNDLEKAVLVKVIAELERIIKVLTEKLAAKTVQEIREVEQKIVEAGKEAVDKIGQELQGAVGEHVDQVKENLGQWKDEVHDFSNNDKVDQGRDVVGNIGEKVGNKVNDVKENVGGLWQNKVGGLLGNKKSSA